MTPPTPLRTGPFTQVNFGDSYIITSVFVAPEGDGSIISYTDSDSSQKLSGSEHVSTNGPYGPLTLQYAGFTVGSQNDPVLYYPGDERYYVVNTSGSSLLGLSVVTNSAALCFLPHTLIRLAGSQQKQAGDLVVGDLVATPEGPQAVKFIGKTTRNIFDLRETGRMPIRIEAGSLGELGPDADIHCTPSHAFHIKGSLVEAQALVNGTTIQQLNDWDELMITYISIELEDHQLVWANGLLAESYYANWRNDGFSRQSWDNYDQYLELYGESESMKELDMPRIPFARQLPAELRLILQLNQSNKALQPV